jgi:multiple sugar transport system permease protein
MKWFAGTLVVVYALITLMPLLWIMATGFKSSTDAIAYPPKVLFEPTLEGLREPVHHPEPRHARAAGGRTRRPETWYDRIVRTRAW